jgi:SulP family sulfate permease
MEIDPIALQEHLKRCPALAGLSVAQIHAIANSGKTLQAQPGQTLFKEGDDSVAMYFLIAGQVEVKGKTGKISTIPEHGLFGEMGVVSKSPRSANMHAIEPSIVFALPRDKFWALIDADKDFGYLFYKNLVAVLTNKLKKNNETVEFATLLTT